MEPKKIRFDFAPVENNLYAVTKDDNGVKHRYLYGISSGEDLDGHGERMTSNCIASFHRQAQSGDVLLYEGKHEVNFVDDIGKVVESKIDEHGDWVTGYRLWDESDGIDAAKLAKIDTVWKQVNGLPPYTKPKPYGFSIEGNIPDGGIKFVDNMGRRTMDDVALDGVVLVNHPAYKTSIVQAVMKGLGYPTQNEVRRALLGKRFDTLKDELHKRKEEKEELSDYFDEKYSIDNALEDFIKRIMNDDDPDKQDRLKTVFDEYAELMIQLALAHPVVFREPEGSPSDAAPSTVYEASEDRKQDLLLRLTAAQDELLQFVQNLRTREAAND